MTTMTKTGQLVKGSGSKNPYMVNDKKDPSIVNVGYQNFSVSLGNGNTHSIPGRKRIAKWSFVGMYNYSKVRGVFKCRQTGKLFICKIK